MRDRRARERAAVGHATPEQIRGRAEVNGYRCYMCGGPADAMDHVKPLAKGGAAWPCNMRPICTACNSRKRDHWPWGRFTLEISNRLYYKVRGKVWGSGNSPGGSLLRKDSALIWDGGICEVMGSSGKWVPARVSRKRKTVESTWRAMLHVITPILRAQYERLGSEAFVAFLLDAISEVKLSQKYRDLLDDKGEWENVIEEKQ